MSAPATEPQRRERDALHARMAQVWGNAPGMVGQLTAVNHSTLGKRFLLTGFVFLLAGGLMAMLIRLQLAWPGATVLDAETYNRLVTMHGTTMMFLFAVPILEGAALYLLPKMLGSRDAPYPRLTAFGYWCYLFGGLFLYASFLFDEVPDAGWFMYVPLSSQPFSAGSGVDFWLLGVTFAEIAALTAAVEIIVTVLKTRAPGMAIQQMPLFAWYMLVTAFMIAFGFPPLVLGSVLLELERAFGFAFYDPARGGDPLLWQHLFWLFGHPEVYVIFLPAAGIVSTLLPVFARRPLVGYRWVVLALLGTGFLSFGLWVHHMFTTGLPLLSLSFFSAASMAVAIPMGIQVFAWLATLWGGRPQLHTPMLFLVGFFFIFVLGGLTGVMVALVPFDWQVHDTHFVVAHLHYVLIGGMLFPLLAAAYYWLPLLSGRQASDSTGRNAFWLLFLGFNLTFLPMHLTGLLGMPRRVYTYSADMGLEWWNLVSTVGGFVFAIGMLAFAIDLLGHYLLGRRGGRDPWRAGTLEWAIPMPAPAYNFVSLPTVSGRDPLWSDPDLTERVDRGEALLADATRGRREMLLTGTLDAVPEAVLVVSSSTWLPLLAAGSIGLVLALFLAGAYLGALLALALTTALLVAWALDAPARDDPEPVPVGRGLLLPLHHAVAGAPGRWGTLLVVLLDAALFASLVYAYFYLWLGAPAWPPQDARLAHGGWALASGAGLLLSALLLRQARRAIGDGSATRFRAWLLPAVGVLVAASFLQALALAGAPPPQQHAYGALVHTLVGFHLVHVVVALLAAGVALLRARGGLLDARRPLEAEVCTLLWYWVVAQGAVVLLVVHLFPRALG